jgi:hypothetical protein
VVQGKRDSSNSGEIGCMAGRNRRTVGQARNQVQMSNELRKCMLVNVLLQVKYYCAFSHTCGSLYGGLSIEVSFFAQHERQLDVKKMSRSSPAVSCICRSK